MHLIHREVKNTWGLSIAHTTIMRWVHQYGPELDKRIRRHLKETNDSWRVDGSYIKLKGQWMYLYCAVDSERNTIDFYLSKLRNTTSAKRFFKKALASFHVSKFLVSVVPYGIISYIFAASAWGDSFAPLLSQSLTIL